MLLAQMDMVRKFYGGRLVLKVDDFRLYSNDRIGIVGVNGSGKTTFLNILTNKTMPDEGTAKIYGNYSYITQLGTHIDYNEKEDIDGYTASRLGVSDLGVEGLSGGEVTRLKIARAFSKDNALIIADEPTSNLDSEGIELLQNELKNYNGAVLVVSHDREFLDEICNFILEIENGEIHLYKGNYSKYKELKEQERERALFEYEQYKTEKSRLEMVIEQKKKKVMSIKRPPKRMGNSEARLHKMGGQGAKAKLDRQIKAIRTRIEKIEVKEKPKELPQVNVDLQRAGQLYCKVVFSSDKLNKSFGKKIIFKDASFKIYNNSKTAIIGPNGSGKTTLVKMIVDGDPVIKRATGAKIGYFSQDMSILKDNMSLLQNVMEDSLYDETFVRTLLARLLFKREDLIKDVSLLSGGEKVKAALAKIIVSDFNVLVLDEPTNYLDIYSMEAVEEALLNYTGTIVFISHDRRFVSNVADHIISIENHKTECFDGTLEEYNRKKELPAHQDGKLLDKMVLQTRLAEILGRLSVPSKDDNVEELDREYRELLEKLKGL